MAAIKKDQTDLMITVDCQMDISTATTLRIYYEKPDETTGNWTAFQVPGSDTKIRYIFAGASFVDQVGTYMVRGYSDGPDGEKYGDKDYFNVEEL